SRAAQVAGRSTQQQSFPRFGDGMTVDVSAAPVVSGPSDVTPPRRPGSVRRTATIDMTWPAGWGTPMRLVGRARDLLTPTGGGQPVVLAEDGLTARVRSDRTIESIGCEPARVDHAPLVGARGGGRLRGLLTEAVP